MAGGAELAILISGKNASGPAFKSAKADVDSLNAAAGKSGPSWLKMSSAMAAGELAAHAVEGAIRTVGGALGGMVGTAADFEASISAIGAVSNASADDMAKISDLALQLGKDTSFSAKEAANGIEELVKGGLSLEDIFSGGAKAALDLAAAGGIEVAEAAEIAANAVGQFGLKGSELAHAADLIAGAANASSLSVTDFKFSLAAVGAVANTVGLSFDDTAVAIAEMGKAGIKGSDAGTSLKTMLMSLQPSTKAQQAAFRELGIVTKDGANQFFTAEGRVKSLAEVQGVLKKATAGLTQEQKIAKLEIMFGSDAIRAAAVLAKEGAEGFDEMAAAMGKVSAADVAAKRLDNLKGSLSQLGGSLETAAISIGVKLTPALKMVADKATEMVNAAIPEMDRLATEAGNSAITFLQAFKGDWRPDGVDENGNIVWVDPMVRKFGEIGVTAGDSWRTFTLALQGKWEPNGVDENGNVIWVDPFVENVGRAGLAIKNFGDMLNSPEFTASAAHTKQNLGDIGSEFDKLAAKFQGGQGKGIDLSKLWGMEQISGELANTVDAFNTFAEAFGAFATGLGLTAQTVKQIFTGDWIGATESANAAAAEFGKIPGIIGDNIQRSLERTTAAAPQISAQARDTWAGYITGAQTSLDQLPSTIDTTMTAADASLATGSATMTATSEAGWAAVVATADPALTQIPPIVDTNMAAADTSAAAGGDKIIATLDLKFGESVGIAETQMPKVTAAVQAEQGPAESAGTGVGQAIVDGLGAALSGGIGWVTAKATELAKSAEAAAKAALGIQSPSTVFMAIGGEVAAGLAQGVAQNAPIVDEAVRIMAAHAVATGVQTATEAASQITATAGLSFQQVRDKYNLTIPPLVSDATMGFQQVRDRFNLVVPPLKDTAGMTFQQVRDNFNLVIPPLQGQANTTLQGLKGASSAVFATVKTAATTTFDAVQKSATETIPKVATELDGVGEQIATATTGVKGFGTELAALNPGPITAMASAWESVADAIHDATKELKKFNKAGGGGGGGGGSQGGDANIGVPSGGFDNIPMFPNGGIMPGFGSRHQLALVQPGEEIRSIAQQRAGGSAVYVSVPIYNNGNIIHEAEFEELVGRAVESQIRGGRLAIR